MNSFSAIHNIKNYIYAHRQLYFLLGPMQALRKIYVMIYRWQLRWVTAKYNRKCMNNPRQLIGKNLYMSPVGRRGQELLKKVIAGFGHNNFDFLIFVYDDAEFKDPIFNCCNFVRVEGFKWQYVKKYGDQINLRGYDYIFFWDDDIDIEGFSVGNFLDIALRNNLDCFQPALTQDSFYSHKITLQKENHGVGRYTDFVEVMVPVFTGAAFWRFLKIIDPANNPWGWGYDYIAKSVCGFVNMAIIDQETVRHTQPVQSKYTDAPVAMRQLFEEYKQFKIAERINVCSLI